MKKELFLSLLFMACNATIPSPGFSQVDSLIVKRDNQVPGRKSVIDQLNETITIKAFNNGIKATNETIAFAIESPANADGQNVVAQASGITDSAGKVKFDATMGDSLGVYTVHCTFGADTLLSIPFDVITNEDYYIVIIVSIEDKMNIARDLVPDIDLPPSEQKQFTNLDGEQKNRRKKTQSTSEANEILLELKNLFELTESLSKKGKKLN